MSVIFGLDYERLPVQFFIGEPPHAWRDMSVIIGVIFSE
jgi:hypothetical protein